MLLGDRLYTAHSDDIQDKQRFHFYHRGETIPLMTQGVWQVCRGWVQLSTTHATGEEVLLGWAAPSSFFGQWSTRLEMYEATALSDVYLRWFFLSEIESSPPLSRSLLTHLNNRLRQTEALLAVTGQRRVEDRLHQLLLLLKDEMGENCDGETRLAVRFTHQNLASAIGTTRVTITRLLGKLQRCGYLRLDEHRHILLNHQQCEGFDRI
ncbi:MAG: Crp/Fnr family transcriptional regulator [Jaaginema sp. PMC 1079.18]|nr:Crp/Fnr family transcriptional regulator [Jaaginema sp. PMC 1080.18]MEC4851455.1 Crp/Fnr family transcriptional regulator [Jaaginema sp. PMC 1079.18]MEC4865957.1 Crp/Fnr family transcriptional regulator [Jaaginema sp. PMC 1078.18]